MLTIAEFNADDFSFHARTVEADAASGEIVIPGRATTAEIIEYANENLAAPFDGHGDYTGAAVVWEREAKADKNGNVYVIVDTGFANTITYYRVKPEHVQQMHQEIDRFNSVHSDPGDNNHARWVDAGHGDSSIPGVAIDYDPAYPPARLISDTHPNG